MDNIDKSHRTSIPPSPSDLRLSQEPHEVLVDERPEWAPAQSDLPDATGRNVNHLIKGVGSQKRRAKNVGKIKGGSSFNVV